MLTYLKNGEALYNSTSDCCGCGVCMGACPKNAITMQQDKYGMLYPIIDQSKCINCHLCINTCKFKDNNSSKTVNQIALAAYNTDFNQSYLSTSAGIFAAIAENFLKDGFVCGAGMRIKDGQVFVEHILIDNLNDLKKLQGSKYVQSDITKCLNQIKEKLVNGKKVLFSGTPCQVANVRSLFKKYSSQLYTIDIICHGVPSQHFFNDFLNNYQRKYKFSLNHFEFRSKKYGWGLTGMIEGKTNKNEYFFKKITPVNTSYYKLFLDGEIYRDSCYNCPYANTSRIGDLTIGDYWGVEKYDPQLLVENGGTFNKKFGISCILINNDNGKRIMDDYGTKIKYAEVDIDNISKINTQLRHPSTYSRKRKYILNEYANHGYKNIERFFIFHRIKNKICYIFDKLFN